MQAHRVMDKTGIYARDLPVQGPVVRRRADGNHRFEAGVPGPLQYRGQFAAPGEGIEMRVGVYQWHA